MNNYGIDLRSNHMLCNMFKKNKKMHLNTDFSLLASFLSFTKIYFCFSYLTYEDKFMVLRGMRNGRDFTFAFI